MAEVKASLLKVEKKIELVEKEIEQVKAALKNKGTYLGSNGRKWQQDQLLQLQEKEQLLMEDKRQLREKELGLLSPQKLAPVVPAETPNMNGDHHDGSSGGSSSAPPKGSGSKVVNVGDSGGVNVLNPAVVYHTNGTVFELPSETIQAVDGFEVPKGFQRSGRREQSFMYSLGVYVKPVDPNDRRHRYFCLATSSCRINKIVIPCKNGDRSNVNTHHKKRHKLRGAQGAIKAGNQQFKATTMYRSKNAGVGISRVREVMAAKLVVDKFLPFTFFSSGPSWTELVGVLTSGNIPFSALPSQRVKHLIVEMYHATKNVVVGNMLEEIKNAPLPIFHQGLCLWTCKESGRKYMAIYGFYVDSKFVLRKVLLRVKHYAPSAAVHETEKASKSLFTIFKATLEEYGIRLSDVAGGTTDSNPVVKTMCTNILLAKHGIPWDCCTCYLADKAIENAFGTSGDPRKSNNKEARDILKLVIKTVAKVNQSTNFKQRFEEIQVEMLEEMFKVTKDTPRRWRSLVRTLERIIRLWHVLRKLYVDDGEEFPLESGSNKDAILQLYSLLHPLSIITRDGQYGDIPMTAEIYMAFAVLKIEVLDPTKPLKVFDIPPAPCSPEEDQARDRDKPPLPSKMVLPSELHPIAAKTRKELSRALVQEVYARVWDTSSADPSPYRDAAVLLTPPFNTGSYLNALRITQDDVNVHDSDRGFLAPTSEADVKRKLSDCWTDINAKALTIATKRQTCAASDVPEGQHPLKRLCTDGASSRSSSGALFCSFGRTVIVGGAGETQDDDCKGNDLLGQVVQEEIRRYRELYMDTSEVDCKTVMSWWGRDGKIKFPFLASVAQQVFGNQATAAHVERDFSACGNLLGPNRSRMDTYWVEMVMFLKANYEHIPACENIPMISSDDIRAYIPARFDGRDTDLLVAEAVFDVLENTEAPPVDGMTVD